MELISQFLDRVSVQTFSWKSNTIDEIVLVFYIDSVGVSWWAILLVGLLLSVLVIFHITWISKVNFMNYMRHSKSSR